MLMSNCRDNNYNKCHLHFIIMARCLKYTPQLPHHIILTPLLELRDGDLFHEMAYKKKKKVTI